MSRELGTRPLEGKRSIEPDPEENPEVDSGGEALRIRTLSHARHSCALELHAFSLGFSYPVRVRASYTGAVTVATLLSLGCVGEGFAVGGEGGATNSGGRDSAEGGASLGSSGSKAGSGGGAGGSAQAGAGSNAGGAGGSDSHGKSCDLGCEAGEYCREDRNECASCSSISRLSFGPGTALALVAPGKNFVFPRAQTDGALERLVYRYDDDDSEPGSDGTDEHENIGTSGGPPFAAGQEAPGYGVVTDRMDSGPLLIPSGVSFPDFDDNDGVLLLDKQLSNGTRSLYVAGGVDATTEVTLLGGTLNKDYGNYHVAAAFELEPIRFWWIKRVYDNGYITKLVTATLSSSSATDVTVPLAAGCYTSTTDVAPWVTKDGTLMLFHGATCGDTSGVRRIFYAELDPMTGLFALGKKGIEVEVEDEDVDTITPSLSPDMCTLYYSSNRTGSYLIYSASRN